MQLEISGRNRALSSSLPFSLSICLSIYLSLSPSYPFHPSCVCLFSPLLSLSTLRFGSSPVEVRVLNSFFLFPPGLPSSILETGNPRGLFAAVDRQCGEEPWTVSLSIRGCPVSLAQISVCASPSPCSGSHVAGAASSVIRGKSRFGWF